MRDYNVGFISNECIYHCVKNTVESYRHKLTLELLDPEIIDWITLTAESIFCDGITRHAIVKHCFGKINYSDSGCQGNFHRSLFKYAGNGWREVDDGFSIEIEDIHIYASFMTGKTPATLRKTYLNMQAKMLEDCKTKCYMVEKMSLSPLNEEWAIFIENTRVSDKNIRRVSIDQFYELVFEDPKAFYKLCMALPKVIEDVVKDNEVLKIKGNDSNFLMDTSRLSTDLYLLVFSQYEIF